MTTYTIRDYQGHAINTGHTTYAAADALIDTEAQAARLDPDHIPGSAIDLTITADPTTNTTQPGPIASRHRHYFEYRR